MKKITGETAQTRVARYKEERRKQLANQFANLVRQRNHDGTSSSWSPLDVAANRKTVFNSHNLNVVQDDEARRLKFSNHHKQTNIGTRHKDDSLEDAYHNIKIKLACESSNLSTTTVTMPTTKTAASRGSNGECDKSAKRKSYLNRSVNCDKMPSVNRHHYHSNHKNNSIHSNAHSHLANESTAKKWNNRVVAPSSLPVPVTTAAVTANCAASAGATTTSTVSISFVSSHKTKNASPISYQRRLSSIDSQLGTTIGSCNGVADCTTPKNTDPLTMISATSTKTKIKDDSFLNSKETSCSRIPKRISSASIYIPLNDSVVSTAKWSACARIEDVATQSHTLVGVELVPDNAHQHQNEQIEYKNRLPETMMEDELPDQIFPKRETLDACVDLTQASNVSFEIIEENSKTRKQSILKNKFDKRSNSLDASKPNSILKRKNFDDCCVKKPATAVSSRQGILKKYYSFDEEEVCRRSYSSETESQASKLQEFKPILKPHRRSSMEELTHNRFPELHSILKRSKPYYEENCDVGATTPLGILKRKTSGPNVEETPPYVEGADAAVKPILKNKQLHTPEFTFVERLYWEAPKPILKKKASSENEVDEEKPKKPILKTSRKSLDEEMANVSIRETTEPEMEPLVLENRGIKPILKKKTVNYAETRGAKSDDDSIAIACPNQVKRNSLSGIDTFVRRSPTTTPENGSPFGVNSHFELFLKMECGHTETPKNVKINFERVESTEIKNSTIEGTVNQQDKILSFESAMEEKRCSRKTSKKNKEEEMEKDDSSSNAPPSNDIKPSYNNDDVQDKTKKSNHEDVKNKLKRSNSVSMKASLFSQLEKDSKKAAEAVKVKKKSDAAGKRKLKVKCSDLASRFSTQPITLEEVAEAKKQNEIGRNKLADIKNEIIKNSLNTSSNVENAVITSAYLSISERVKMFAEKLEKCSNVTMTRKIEKVHNRFKTQPVTLEEVQMAKQFTVKSNKSAVESGKIPVIGVKIIENPKVPPVVRRVTENTAGLLSERNESSSGGREVRSVVKKAQQEKKSEDNKRGPDPIMKCESVVAESKDVDDCPVINGKSSIAQRLAALEKSGQVDWKKRISRFASENEVPSVININQTQEILQKELTNGCRNKKPADEHGKEGTLADRLVKLQNARQTWKKRVEPSDAAQFSVAGKMASTLTAVPKPSSSSTPPSERKKRGICASRFQSFREQRKNIHSDPTSPQKSKSTAVVCRSNSLPSEITDDDDEKSEAGKNDSIVVPQIFDEQFSTFFGNVENVARLNVDPSDFISDLGDIKIDTPKLLPTHKKIRAQRKHGTSGNPLKTMAAKINIKNEYTEVKTNVAEKEKKRINVEKLSKNSALAVEALAGLASKEDFQAVQLKKAAPLSSPLLPYKQLMLLHVKGRRHVQTRLVKPAVESINSGDSYVLITPNEVYHWIGQFSNVIERSRSAEIAQHVVATHDLGCANASNVITVTEDGGKTNSKTTVKFWTLLGATPEQAATVKAIDSGHPDEDEEYENSLLSTNMVYEVKGDELVPVEKYWATIPKIQMLDPNKVFVLDFGSELYVWMGKNVDLKLRKSSTQLAKELWENGFNYEECDLCPITSSLTIGSRNGNGEEVTKRGNERPDWCLFAKVTQHMETVLFREKFLDWPDFTRVIRAKGKDEDTERQTDSSFDLNPCDVTTMLEEKCVEPDLVLEGSHLGRGDKFFEEELRRFFVVKTSDVRMWHIAEFESELVPNESLGQFYSTDSYVVRWLYSVSSTGRELSGLPSKHTTTGRDRCVYFCWQGKNASLNEQGAAALLTVELDQEKGIQLRICQGYEPPAFFRLFEGKTVIYKSKTNSNCKGWRLFVCRGEVEQETALLEVTCNIKQLRSRACFVLINANSGTTYVWNGCKTNKAALKVCESIVNRLKEKPAPEFGLNAGMNLKVTVVDEGSEPKEFFAGLGGSSRKMYLSLLDDKKDYDCTPLLFSLSSNSGSFCAASVWSSCRHRDIVTAYPFLQEDLYLAHQPALFLLDTGKELWLWQGWWPERAKTSENEATIVEDLDNRRGSATVRWQAERRAAMQTALNYWKRKYADKSIEAYLVWAGLEPVEFTNLFPDWEDRDDVTEINISDGRKPGELLDIKQELERLTQSTYPIEQLLQRPLPDGVDPTKLELYLSESHFKEILKVSKEEFIALPSWKQTNLKKDAGLF